MSGRHTRQYAGVARMGTVQPMRVAVPVSSLWTDPSRPRPVDAAIVADDPDSVAWLRALDQHELEGESGDGRQGLHGRLDSQLVAGEPVLVVADDATESGSDSGADPGAESGSGSEWVQVFCPWQPSSLDERGYPGWLRRAHLIPDDTGGHTDGPSDESWIVAGRGVRPDLELAREHLGLVYLWGGMSPWGLDCSGLVHLVQRELGRVVPRDAHDQRAICEPVELDAVQPGDLYFFAGSAEGAADAVSTTATSGTDHVGIVTAPMKMIHACGHCGVVEEPLDDGRRATLVAAGRLPG